jgi:hypothetical protein
MKKKDKTKKKVTFYKDYNKFAKRVGILEEEELEALGWKCDNGNRICTSKLEELKKFVAKLNRKPSNAEKFILGKSKKKQKKYHICTDYDACEAEDSYCEEKGIDPEDEERRVVATVMDNRIGFVNRMDYFLCDGDDDENISLEEIEEI